MKTCRVCGETKSFEDFYASKGCRDGRRPECKACNLATRRAKYLEDPRPYIDRVLKWQRENPERHKAKQRECVDSGRKSVSSRKSHLKRTYGLTLEQFNDLLASQDFGCAICGKPAPDNVDHDHLTGRVRGILCWDCNIALGKFADDADRLLAAGAYLSRSNELTDIARDRVVALSS